MQLTAHLVRDAMHAVDSKTVGLCYARQKARSCMQSSSRVGFWVRLIGHLELTKSKIGIDDGSSASLFCSKGTIDHSKAHRNQQQQVYCSFRQDQDGWTRPRWLVPLSSSYLVVKIVHIKKDDSSSHKFENRKLNNILTTTSLYNHQHDSNQPFN